jgi:hypothetical protein
MQDLGKNQGQATGTLTEKQVINLLDGAGAAYASKRHNQVRFPVPRAANLKNLPIGSYTASLSVTAVGVVSLSLIQQTLEISCWVKVPEGAPL